MPSYLENNKRIAKNTLLLYVRMFITMLVGLYTSRVILNTLGVSDYGLYNVIGGIVAMFGFLNGTLASGTQRFLTFLLGRNDIPNLKRTFSAALTIHFVLAIVIVIIAETIGLWFIYNKLNIAPGRMSAAVWVFHFSVLASALSIMQVPYMSSLISHERMEVYAYMSIYDVVMKLLIVYLIQIVAFDKLKFYASLILLVNVTSILIYRIYCTKQFQECKFKFSYNKSIYKEMLTFSGWNVFGCLASVCSNQGINILLNIFFSTIINAAYGISAQINNVVQQFVNNFQMAVDPQIVKLYASNKKEEMFHLVINNSLYATYLMLLIAIPLFLEMEFILKLWLKIVPEYTVSFTRIILIQCIIRTVGRPIVMSCHAVGKMKIVNLTAGGSLLLILPISYILLKLNYQPTTILIASLFPFILEISFELLCLNKYISFPIPFFMRKVILKLLEISILSSILPAIIYCSIKDGWERFILIVFFSVISSSFFIYNLGIGKNMKFLIKSKINYFVNKKYW